MPEGYGTMPRRYIVNACQQLDQRGLARSVPALYETGPAALPAPGGMSRPVARGTEEYREALERANQSVATGLHNLEAIKASGRVAHIRYIAGGDSAQIVFSQSLHGAVQDLALDPVSS